MSVAFKGLEVIRECRADRVDLPHTLVHIGMEEYSGWGWLEHVHWIAELSGLDLVTLVLLVGQGYVLSTDESVSEVWLLSNDYYRTTARLLYEDG